MNKIVKFKTSKTVMYINTDHVSTMTKLSKTLTDNGDDPCDYGISMCNGMKFAITEGCLNDICSVMGIANVD